MTVFTVRNHFELVLRSVETDQITFYLKKQIFKILFLEHDKKRFENCTTSVENTYKNELNT